MLRFAIEMVGPLWSAEVQGAPDAGGLGQPAVILSECIKFQSVTCSVGLKTDCGFDDRLCT